MVLAATASLLGEGFDHPPLDTLFLAFPVRFKGNVVQYVGRVLRPTDTKTRIAVHDYVDVLVPVLARMHDERGRAYATRLRPARAAPTVHVGPQPAGQDGRVSRRPDLEARLEDLTALLSAGDADELHQALVLGSPAAYEREPMMPLCYFTQVHERSPEGALTTAVLLATDARFESTSRPLMHALAGTGLLSGDDLDLLAQLFVAAGPHVYWACPDNWFEVPPS